MRYFLFNSNIELAQAIDNISKIDTYYIDLEIIGKEERQKNRNSLISYHKLDDIDIVRNALNKTSLGVRINPINNYSESEINSCIKRGANVLMLPMFKKLEEVEEFINIIDKRCSIDLLVETPEALSFIDKLPFKKIRYIHFGINDLSIAFNYKIIFQMYFEEKLKKATKYLKDNNITFGIGGIGNFDAKPFSPNLIFSAAISNGAERIILSRNFLSKINKVEISKSIEKNLIILNNIYEKLKILENDEINKNLLIFKNEIHQKL